MLQNHIEESIPKLMNMARELAWNKLSENCKFILTEIKDSGLPFHLQRISRKKENGNKTPVSLPELMPTLQKLYDNFYDINLHIYRATKSITVIEIRYYPKSALDKNYRQAILKNPPMLHCKVSIPPWISDKSAKFDINWELNEKLIMLRLLWIKLKTKVPNKHV